MYLYVPADKASQHQPIGYRGRPAGGGAGPHLDRDIVLPGEPDARDIVLTRELETLDTVVTGEPDTRDIVPTAG